MQQCREDPPIVVFQHSRSRSAETAKKIFTDFKGGALTVDGYAGYDALGNPKKTNQPWGIIYCWTRRQWLLEPMAQPQATDAGSSNTAEGRTPRSASK